jgi:hypothetical protein
MFFELASYILINGFKMVWYSGKYIIYGSEESQINKQLRLISDKLDKLEKNKSLGL